MGETGKSKAKRVIFWGVIGVLVAILLPWGAAALGTYAAEPLLTNGVLPGDSGIATVWNNGSHQIAVGHSAGTASWTMPTGATTSYIFTNFTMGELQGASVTQITFTSAASAPGNLTIGFGTDVGDYQEYANYQTADLQSIAVTISPSYLTGNGSLPFVAVFTSSAGSYSGFGMNARGLSAIGNVFGPWVVENIAYVVGTVLALVAGTLAMHWLDIDTSKVSPRGFLMIMQKRRRERRSGKHREHAHGKKAHAAPKGGGR